MRTRGVKNGKFLRTSFMDGPLVNMVTRLSFPYSTFLSFYDLGVLITFLFSRSFKDARMAEFLTCTPRSRDFLNTPKCVK